MNNKARTSVLFVILLLVLSLGATGFYYISFEKEKAKSVELMGQLDSAKEEKEIIVAKLKQIDEEKSAIEIKLKDNQELISKLNDKLTQEIKARELLKTEQDTLRNKIVEISQQKNMVEQNLNEKLQEIASLQSQLDSALTEKAGFKGITSRVVSIKEELPKEEPLKEEPVLGKESVDLEKIVVAPASNEVMEEEILEEAVQIKEEPKRPALSCEVLLINREYSFLVLNVGLTQGVEIGDVFEVSHSSVSIGRIKIEKVHERMSAANFLPGFVVDAVNEGDAANRID